MAESLHLKRAQTPLKGRGASSNPNGRYESSQHAAYDDGWDIEEEPEKLRTSLHIDKAKTVIAKNDSPDVGFSASINPYRGCEHGCVYCFARPTHGYFGLSSGLDFESRIFYKPEIASLLETELRKPRYTCHPLAVGIITDGYQPAERKLKLTRACLEVLSRFNHPLSIVTKSCLVERDIDILAPMAEKGLVQVYISLTTLDHELARRMEPRTSAPRRRLQAMKTLHNAGIPVGVLVAPLIPVLTDSDLEAILEQSRDAGAESAGYVVLRLPHDVKDLFREWLERHEPLKANHVMSVVRSLHGGKDYDAKFGQRMRGTGEYAELLANRFRLACKRLGLNRGQRNLNRELFKPPIESGDQMRLL